MFRLMLCFFSNFRLFVRILRERFFFQDKKKKLRRRKIKAQPMTPNTSTLSLDNEKNFKAKHDAKFCLLVMLIGRPMGS